MAHESVQAPAPFVRALVCCVAFTLESSVRRVSFFLCLALLSCREAEPVDDWRGQAQSRTLVSVPLASASLESQDILLPVGLGRSDVALSAYEALVLGNGAAVLGQEGSGIAADPGQVVTFGSLWMGAGSEVGSLTLLGSGPVNCHPGARVRTFIRTLGASRERRGGALPRAAWGQVEVDSLAQKIIVSVPRLSAIESAQGSTHSPNEALASGAHGSLVVRRGDVSRLGRGAHTFSSLQVEAGGVLLVDNTEADSRIWVTDSLTLNGRIELVVERATLQLVSYAPEEMELRFPWYGTLVAPRARVTLGTGAEHHGSIVARAIELRPGVRFRHEPMAPRPLVLADEALAHGCGECTDFFKLEYQRCRLDDAERGSEIDCQVSAATVQEHCLRRIGVSLLACSTATRTADQEGR